MTELEFHQAEIQTVLAAFMAFVAAGLMVLSNAIQDIADAGSFVMRDVGFFSKTETQPGRLKQIWKGSLRVSIISNLVLLIAIIMAIWSQPYISLRIDDSGFHVERNYPEEDY